MFLLIDNIVQVETSLAQTKSAIGSEILKITERLDNLFKFNNQLITQEEILEEIQEISNALTKIRDLENPVEKLRYIRVLQDYTKILKWEFIEHAKNETIEQFDYLEENIKELETLQVIRIFLETVNVEVKTGGEWLKNLYNAFLQLMEIMENGNLHLIPKSILETIKIVSKVIATSEDSKKYIPNKKGEETHKNIKKYIVNLRSIAKAILWEISKYQQNVKRENNSWDLVIGTRPLKELLEESKKRIHLLDKLDPQTEEEEQEHLDTLRYLEQELKNR